MKKYIFLCLFLFLTLSLCIAASIDTITFQGRLLDSIGNPINGKRYMIFRIYNHITDNTGLITFNGGAAQAVVCNDGNYAIELPLDTNYQTFNGYPNSYLEIWVGATEAEVQKMQPRIHLTGSAYSLSTNQIHGFNITRSGSAPDYTNQYIDY